MAAAARLAARSRPQACPNPGVGALLIASHGAVLSRGWTATGGRPHAEAMALGAVAYVNALRAATLYVTLEPCAHQSPRGPACADLIIKARPRRVVIGQHDPDPRTAGKGIALLKAAGIETCLLDDAASAASLAGFLARQNAARPHVTLKLAMSLDGCIALGDGQSRWITGEAARAHVHAQRARNDAILVGGGTWRTDSPRLDVRLPGLEARSPRRVVLTHGIAPDGVIAIAAPQAITTLEDVLYLYIEGGAATAAAFLKADLVDELHLYRAPILIGDGLRGMGSLELADLASAHGRWRLNERRQLGSDTFEAYLRTRD